MQLHCCLVGKQSYQWSGEEEGRIKMVTDSHRTESSLLQTIRPHRQTYITDSRHTDSSILYTTTAQTQVYFRQPPHRLKNINSCARKNAFLRLFLTQKRKYVLEYHPSSLGSLSLRYSALLLPQLHRISASRSATHNVLNHRVSQHY